MAKPKFTISEIEGGDMGVCLACGEIAEGVEPDARRYKCESCGKKKVYGLSEAALMGAIDVVPEGRASSSSGYQHVQQWRDYGRNVFLEMVRNSFQLTEDQIYLLQFMPDSFFFETLVDQDAMYWNIRSMIHDAIEELRDNPDLLGNLLNEISAGLEGSQQFKDYEDSRFARWHKAMSGRNPPFGVALYGYDGSGYSIGDRVELHPATDMWMRGARYGTVVGVKISSAEGYRALYGKEKPKHTVEVRLDKMPNRIFAGLEDQFRPIE